jgi:predicted esterase YcpF (UPF0227 family)
MIKQIFLCYTDHLGFQELDGRAGYEFMLEAAHIMERHYTQIHSDSTRETDPIVDIIVITDTPLDRAQAEAIDQSATNWLHETGRHRFPSA